MGIRDFFNGAKASQPAPATPSVGAAVHAALGAEGGTFAGLTDPALLDFMRSGTATGSGAYVSAHSAMKNMAVLRCVRLISEAIGMLPLNILEDTPERGHATELGLYKLLRRKPNDYQSAYDFKKLMQLRVLVHGNAYARIVWSGPRPIALIPLEPEKTEPKLGDDWKMTYEYTRTDGRVVVLPAREVFHLRDLSLDGVKGLSVVKLAAEAIGLALQAETAAARLFRNGMMVGGALKHPGKLGDDAFKRLKEGMEERYSGSANAHKWMVLEEGMTAEQFAQTAADSQHLETRNHQIEEVARAFGVPRPLLAMDDTSWGSGIEQLGIYFVQYTLQPWFTCWEQAIARSLFSDTEAERYFAKFNERALMRGTLKDQADFFAKALGSGGHSPWLSVNEVRDLSDMPESKDKNADSFESPLMRNKTNEPAKAPA